MVSLFILPNLLTYHLFLNPQKERRLFQCKHKNKKNSVANYCYSVEWINAEEKIEIIN